MAEMIYRMTPPAGIDCPVRDMETVWIRLVGEPIRVEGPGPDCAEINAYEYCSEFCRWACWEGRVREIEEGRR